MGGFDPLTVGLIAGAATAATGIAGSIQQNNAIDETNRRNAEQAAKVAAANKAIAEQEAIDKRASLARQADAYSAAIRTTTESRGTLGSDNQFMLNRSVQGWAARENANVGIQLNATKNAIDAGSMPNFIPRGSTALDAFGGLLGGLQTGLGLYSSLTNLQLAQKQLAAITPPEVAPPIVGTGNTVVGSVPGEWSR